MVDAFRRVDGSQVYRPPEQQGFIVLMPIPDPQRNVRGRVRYFPRMLHGNRRNRRHADIDLIFVNRPYARMPYYAELDSRPIEGSEPYETIRLYVDREVEVRIPEGAERLRSREPWRTVFRLDFPADYRVMSRQTVFIVIHRTQSEAAIPQSPIEASRVFAPPTRFVGLADRAVVTSGRFDPLVTTVSVHPYAAWETVANGGCRITLGRETLSTNASLMGAHGHVVTSDVLGTVITQYFNPEFRGAYHVDASMEGDEVVVTLTMSQNVFATFWVVGANADLIDRALDRDHIERARAELADSGLQLRIVTGTAQVPRPGDPVPAGVTGTSWDVSDALERQLYVRGARDQDAEFAFAWIDASTGLLPIVGDIYDAGHLAYAIATGEDFSGAPVDGFSLLLMGLAVLPGVTGAVRQVEGLADEVAAASRALQATGRADAVRAAIVARRSALALLRQMPEAASELVGRWRGVVSHSGVSDAVVARAVRNVGGTP